MWASFQAPAKRCRVLHLPTYSGVLATSLWRESTGSRREPYQRSVWTMWGRALTSCSKCLNSRRPRICLMRTVLLMVEATSKTSTPMVTWTRASWWWRYYGSWLQIMLQFLLPTIVTANLFLGVKKMDCLVNVIGGATMALAAVVTP